ncbi:hypothetical protein H0H87_003604 [Tephrocybe sp. NHM501043]|nr:hypothetical protein H0H87_003604 [Tephrocybe sp. NHM501043]
MYLRPEVDLDGTAALNVTRAISSCVYELNQATTSSGICTTVADLGAQDSYLWYDELHPRAQADRIVAKKIAALVGGGKSRWAERLA